MQGSHSQKLSQNKTGFLERESIQSCLVLISCFSSCHDYMSRNLLPLPLPPKAFVCSSILPLPSLCLFLQRCIWRIYLIEDVLVLGRLYPLVVLPSTLSSPSRYFTTSSRSLSFWLCNFHTAFTLCSNLLGHLGILWFYFSSRHLHPYYFSYC